MYPGVELRLLRYVVAVAEELHFSRAATKLHVTQPSLSKQIIELEAELGLDLFERTKRDVRLTDAGKAFVQEAKVALLHSQRAIHVAKAKKEPNRFNLGYSPYVDFDLLSSVRSFASSQFPDVNLSLVSSFNQEQVQMLHRGQLDAGLVILPVEQDGLAVHRIKHEPLIAALPKQHLLRDRRILRLRDLNGTRLIVVSKQWHPQFYKQCFEICASQGYTPNIVQKVRTELEAMHMVAEGLGFTFSRRCFERSKWAGIVFKPIEGSPLAVESALIYRVRQQSSILTGLMSSLVGKRTPQAVKVPSQRQMVAV